MRILYFGNNRLGLEVLQWLIEQEEELAGLVLHPASKQKCGAEFLDIARSHHLKVIDGSTLQQTETLAEIRRLDPAIGLSVLFDYILKPQLLDLLPQGCLNLHPSYLPYNRGQYPNVWSIVEGTPSGVTLHYIDEGIDTGPIVALEMVPVDITDTGETLYRKLEHTSLKLFQSAWPEFRAGIIEPATQASGQGTYHRTRDVERIDRIDLDQTYKARDLINILRARTFPPYPGAYFEEDGRRVYLRLYLEEADSPSPRPGAER